MTYYTLDTDVQENAPRVHWRNLVLEESDAPTLDVFIDETTWQTDTVPADIELSYGSYPSQQIFACNAIGIAGGNWSGQIVSVYFDDDDSGFQLLGTWQPLPGQPFLGIFPFQTAHRWRITITNGTLIASVIKLGMALAMQRNLYGGVAPISKRVNKVPNNQLGAHFSGSQVVQTRRETGDLKFDKLTPDWVRAYLQPWVVESRLKSAFIAWRPDTYRHEVVYGTTDRDIKVTNEMGNGMMQTSFGIEGSAT